MEEALASAEFLEAAYQRLQDGEHVTGPAAKRYAEGIRLYGNKFGGRYLTNRQAAALRSNPKLRIYDSEEQFVTCCYDQSKALCHPDRRTAGVEQTPDITNCRPNWPVVKVAVTGRHLVRRYQLLGVMPGSGR